MRSVGLAIVVTSGLLQGCTVAQQLADGVRCDGFCVRDFPGEQMESTRRTELVLLPPLYTLSVRDGRHEEVGRQSGLSDSFGQALHTQFTRPARAYEIDMQYRHIDQLPAPFSETQLIAWHETIWVQDEAPEEVRATTPLWGLGAPEVIDPKALPHLTLDQTASDALDGACCVLLMRINGWAYTRATASGKTAVAIGFSGLPGGSGYIPPTSDVIADALVVRVEDGTVVWSGRYIGPANPVGIRRLIMPYLSQTYNANARLARTSTEE